MAKLIKLFYVALFATMSLALTSCGDEDEPKDSSNDSAAFIFDGEKLYTRNYDTLDNIRIVNMMQINCSLYKTPDAFSGEDVDIYPVAGITLEIKPFNVETTSKGTALEVITSRRTYISDIRNGFSIGTSSVSGINYYFKPTSGKVTFEGYDAQKNTVTIQMDITMANPSNSIKLNGKVICEYIDDSYCIDEYGDGDYPY